MDAKITPKSSQRRQSDVKNDRGEPRDAPKPSKWHPRGAMLDLYEFYRCFKAPKEPFAIRVAWARSAGKR